MPYLHAPVYDATNAWLVEGIADHIRDRLGMEMAWTFAHFEVGKASAGYQTTAHFLAWLEDRGRGRRDLCRRLADGTYDEGAFGEIGERPLSELIAAYEAAMSRPVEALRAHLLFGAQPPPSIRSASSRVMPTSAGSPASDAAASASSR